MEQAIVDLVLASFDLYELHISRANSEDITFLTQSFIVNKLPLLLTSLSSVAISTDPMPVLISKALGRVPVNTPQRDAFLLACAVHGLITAENIEEFTGAKPSHVPTKVHKASLAQKYQADTLRVEASISKLQDMDGNVSAHAEAIADVSIVLHANYV
jgi:mediator of RNA polymerase II transcription subunit 5